MPLILNTEIADRQAKLGIWEIQESLEFLKSNVRLSKNEELTFEKIKNENRKKQWLASRIILDKISETNKLSIVYKENGQPLIKDGTHQISISHTTKYVAVILSQFLNVGIDIEGIHPRVLKIRHKFVSNEEDHYLNNSQNLEESLILIWSAKEALFKMHGKQNVDFRKNITIKPFKIQPIGEIESLFSIDNNARSHHLHYKKIHDHMLVYVTSLI